MNLDDALSRLAATPVPDLTAIDGSELADRARVQRRNSNAALGLALVTALGIGIASGMQQPVQVQPPLAAFGPPPALTPLMSLVRK